MRLPRVGHDWVTFTFFQQSEQAGQDSRLRDQHEVALPLRGQEACVLVSCLRRIFWQALVLEQKAAGAWVRVGILLWLDTGFWWSRLTCWALGQLQGEPGLWAGAEPETQGMASVYQALIMCRWFYSHLEPLLGLPWEKIYVKLHSILIQIALR